MLEILQVFLDAITLMFDFVVANLVPESAADINIIHGAIWIPVATTLVGGVVVLIKGFWRKGGRKST